MRKSKLKASSTCASSWNLEENNPPLAEKDHLQTVKRVTFEKQSKIITKPIKKKLHTVIKNNLKSRRAFKANTKSETLQRTHKVFSRHSLQQKLVWNPMNETLIIDKDNSLLEGGK